MLFDSKLVMHESRGGFRGCIAPLKVFIFTQKFDNFYNLSQLKLKNSHIITLKLILLKKKSLHFYYFTSTKIKNSHITSSKINFIFETKKFGVRGIEVYL